MKIGQLVINIYKNESREICFTEHTHFITLHYCQMNLSVSQGISPRGLLYVSVVNTY